MDSQYIVCESCDTRLKVPSSLAPGKKVKCPKCGGVVVAGTAAGEATYSVTVESAPEPAAARPVHARVGTTPGAAATKSCPYCGEQVLASAVKCRHCGEFLDEGKTTVREKRGARPAAGSDNELTPAEYIVAVLGAPIGLVIGIIWSTRGLRKAKTMLQASALSCITLAVGAVVYWEYFIRKDPHAGLPVAKAGPGAVSPPIYNSDESDESPVYPPGRRQMPPNLGGADSKVDLSDQPPHIKRAMRSIVLVTSQNSLGSGVVVQRDGNEALIITNKHVVDNVFARSHGVAETPFKQLQDLFPPLISYLNVDDKEHGKVLWVAEPGVDLALVRARCPDDLDPVPWQASGKVLQGEPVFAIGHPIGLSWTMTKGVVSALRQEKHGLREIPTIQTDASITHGNSGGGLYNDKGELIGINTFIANPALGSNLGFSIRTTVFRDLKPTGLKIPEATATNSAP